VGLFDQLPMIEARIYLQHTRYKPVGLVAIALGATEHDVNIPSDWIEYRVAGMKSIVPVVNLSKQIGHAIELLPGETDFSKGFRIALDAAAPAGLTLNYGFLVGSD